MAKTNHTLAVELMAKTEKFKKDMQSATKSLDKVSKKMSSIGKKMAISVSAPLVAIGGLGLKSAMELEATEAKFSTVFGNMADDVDAYISEFQRLTPATKASARSMASGIQDLLVPMGFLRENATQMTKETMHLVGALTNFNSATHSAEDVALAFQSALTGEYMPLKRLGIQTNKTKVQQKALAMGLAGSTEEVDAQDEALALLEIAYEQSGDALNAYTEESLDTKTKLGLLRAQLTDLGGDITSILLPSVQKAVDKARTWTAKFEDMDDATKKQILTIGGLVAGIAPLLLGLSTLISSVTTITGVFKGLSMILSAHPLLIIAGVVAGIAYKMGLLDGVIETVKEAFNKFDLNSFIDLLKSHLEPVLETVKGAFDEWLPVLMDVGKTLLDTLVPVLQDLWDTFVGLLPTVKDLISKAFELLLPIVEKIGDAIKKVAPVFVSLGKTIIDALMPVIGALIDGVGELIEPFMEVVDILADKLEPVFYSLVKALEPAVKIIGTALTSAIQFVVGLFKMLLNISKPVIDILGDALVLALKGLQEAFEFLAPLFESFQKNVLPKLLAVFEKVGDVVGAITAEDIYKAFADAWDWIKSIWSGAVGWFSDIVSDIKGLFSGIWDSIGDITVSIGDGVGDVFSGLWDGMKSGINSILGFIEDAINAIPEKVNKIFNSIRDIKVFGSTPFDFIPHNMLGNGINIPELAEGGVVSSPTLAMVGEGNENEVVAPLSSLRQMLNGGAGKTANIYVNLDGRTIARVIGQELVDELQIQTGLSY